MHAQNVAIALSLSEEISCEANLIIGRGAYKYLYIRAHSPSKQSILKQINCAEMNMRIRAPPPQLSSLLRSTV